MLFRISAAVFFQIHDKFLYMVQTSTLQAKRFIIIKYRSLYIKVLVLFEVICKRITIRALEYYICYIRWYMVTPAAPFYQVEQMLLVNFFAIFIEFVSELSHIHIKFSIFYNWNACVYKYVYIYCSFKYTALRNNINIGVVMEF